MSANVAPEKTARALLAPGPAIKGTGIGAHDMQPAPIIVVIVRDRKAPAGEPPVATVNQTV